ncbi:MAG: peptidylprolyl isomerase [Pseudomonadota bacterium]
MTNLFRLCFGAFVVASLIGGVAPAQTVFKPVAVVNESVITGFDLAQRARLLSTMDGRGRPAEAFQRQALETLIVDRLKIQAGEAIGLSATEEVVQIGFDLFAQQNGLEPEVLRERLNGDGVTNQAIDDFVAAETIWREVVRARFLAQAEPSSSRIDEELRLSVNLTNTSYRLNEIGLKFTGDRQQDQQISAAILQLYNQLQGGGDFQEAARQFSQTPSAERGGELGWVPGNRMPTDLVRDLNRLEIGQITRPVSIQGGVAILQLVERRTDGSDGNIKVSDEERELVRERLLSQEVNRLAEGFLQEIRRDALIEIR